jgi:hypothetical protein
VVDDEVKSAKIEDSPIRPWMDNARLERYTGILTVQNEEQEAKLYILFGHLFHAVNGQKKGQEVVFDVLGWTNGEYSFDYKAKLPAEDSIKEGTKDLLEAYDKLQGTSLATDNDNQTESKAQIETVVPEEDVLDNSATKPEPESSYNSFNDFAAVSEKKENKISSVPPENVEVYPFPMGTYIYEALATSFIDFPKLLRNLKKENRNGYIELKTTGFESQILLVDGVSVETFCTVDGETKRGKEAYELFVQKVDEGEGNIDVIELDSATITAIHHIFTGSVLYGDLYGRFIKLDGLLEFLKKKGTSGCLLIRSGETKGVALLRVGKLIGAYTTKSRKLNPKFDVLLTLAEDPEAEIEVREGFLEDNDTEDVEPVVSSPTKKTQPVPPLPPEDLKDEDEEPVEEVVITKDAVLTEHLQENSEEIPEPESISLQDEGKTPETTSGAVDWPLAIAMMTDKADQVLGSRAKKVKELLLSTGSSKLEIEKTIDAIPKLSIMFVDPSKLRSLANELRTIAGV